MILKASQRSNAANLSRHLMNDRDNEHVELHELRGFISEDLHGALLESEAMAKGTRCSQHLFSLSLNPPSQEQVSIEDFEAAIDMAEAKLGLDDQPRAIVFHEKEGRRHAHVVWSRIDALEMKAVPLPFFKGKLMDVSRELYLENGWEMPRGLIDRELRNPLNFTREEWQQAKRANLDPRLIKAAFRECWSRSDDADSLKQALEERGYFLAKGDRRAVVAIDHRGEVFSLSRYAGIKAKEMRDRLGDLKSLPSVDETKALIAQRMTRQLDGYVREVDAKYERLDLSVEFKRERMINRQRDERKELNERHDKRWDKETAERAARLPKGMGGLWSRITGKYGKIRRQNEYEAWQSYVRDSAEKDALIARHLEERQQLQRAITRMRKHREAEMSELRAEIAQYLQMRRNDLPKLEKFNERAKTLDRQRRRDQGHDGPDLEL